MNSRFGYLIPMKPSGDRLVPIEAARFTVGRSLKNTHAVYNGGTDEQGTAYSMFYFYTLYFRGILLSLTLPGLDLVDNSEGSTGKKNNDNIDSSGVATYRASQFRSSISRSTTTARRGRLFSLTRAAMELLSMTVRSPGKNTVTYASSRSLYLKRCNEGFKKKNQFFSHCQSN